MKVVYVGPFFYPSSQANSLRVKGMVEALKKAGHDIHVVCLGEKYFSQEIDGIHITQIPEYSQGTLSGLGNGLRGLFLGDATTEWLEKNHIKPDAIILYGTHTGYLLRIKRYCRRNGIKLFLDVVEWYQPSHMPGGAIGPFSIANELSMRVFARRVDGIFAISSYLESHFQRLGLPVLRVPPLFNKKVIQKHLFRSLDGKLHICYAGTPGRKELLSEMFAGIRDAVDYGALIQMHMVGMTANNAKTLGLPVEDLEGIIKFYGRVPNQEAVSIISSCDFMLLLRPNQRFSRAGFPSKIVESLSCGTPIITNMISNISECITDKENAIVIEEPSPYFVTKSILAACRLDDDALKKMQASALKSSERFFPEAHASKISRFISGKTIPGG